MTLSKFASVTFLGEKKKKKFMKAKDSQGKSVVDIPATWQYIYLYTPTYHYFPN